jgi:hypothetical protein
MARAHKLYVLTILALFAATLLPILALNLILSSHTLGDTGKEVERASDWQQRTRGVTYAPTLSDTGPFKMLRLEDRLPDINTVIFGSSTALSIRHDMLPPPMRAFNFAQTGHPLSAAIGEAEWLMGHTSNIRYLVIPMDWALGFVYQPGNPTPANLDAGVVRHYVGAIRNSASLLARMRDALSYPRIVNLAGIVRKIVQASDHLAAFRQYFLQDSSDDYRCADGTPARDFDTFDRGTCTGFRFDGSATFANLEPVSDPQRLILSATASSSQYVTNLTRSQGRPNPVLLSHLAALAWQAENRGGKLLLLMPPLLPGLETAFMRQPQLSAALARTRQTLRDWATRQNIVVIDAGASERFGCSSSEFVDQHHALSSCYGKIFSTFWHQYAPAADGKIAWPTGGLYQP